MNKDVVILKKGKDKPIRNRHHWIFSGAVFSMPDFEDGVVMPVKASNGDFLGQAYFNKRSSIIGRMISFDDRPVKDIICGNIRKAFEYRKQFIPETTDSYRIVNAEGDCLPGLIVDLYKDVVVLQIATFGMEKLKDTIVEALKDILHPKCIYEKSKIPARKEEGLKEFEGALYGELYEPIEIKEDSVKFLVNIKDSQKTGFYFDQSQTRKLVQSISKHRRVLNCFSYTGAFSVYALRGGAERVNSVDQSEDAVGLARENLKLNGYDIKSNKFYVASVFEFLRNETEPYDFIILDPPAFCRKRQDVINACKGYKDINRLAIEKVEPNGLVLTCSCSYHVDESLFRMVVFEAASEAKRNVRIIQKHHIAYDHPINIYHPETEYLKSLLLYVE